MPKAAPRKTGPTATTSRKTPYPKTSPKSNKENIDPSRSSSSPKDPPTSYHSIPLAIIAGEIPIYDSASTIRRKLSKLLTDKSPIPDSDDNKKWNKTTMASEMQMLERLADHEVEFRSSGNNMVSGGPTAAALGKFMKKSGEMGGGDSPCYYWGNVLLEKLRIYNGEKKSKSRLEAEKRLPKGHKRWDPNNVSMWCGPGLPRPSVAELNNVGR